MKFLLRGLVLFVVVIGLLVGGFSLYAHFLMDYSLESLTLVASATKNSDIRSGNISNASQNMYRGMIQDMALEEAAQETIDFQNLTLLDLSSRSLEEAQYRAGYARANVYLNKVIENKKPERHSLLLKIDFIAKKILGTMQSIYLFLKYTSDQIFKKSPVETIKLEEYSSLLLLNQAQEKERQGLLAQAESDYKKFLKAYPDHPSRGLVIISYSNAMMKQRKFEEAVRFLSEMRPELFGKPENDFIEKLLRRIDFILGKQKVLKKLKVQVSEEKDSSVREHLLLKVGVGYMATYDFENAKEIFSTLSNSEKDTIRQKAGFYLGWIYKLGGEYDKSAEVFAMLLKEPQLQADLELGLRSQLADVYYKKGDAKKSAEQYQTISNKTDKVHGTMVTVHSAWASFSELEMVNIYYFDLKDSREARERLDKIINLAELGVDIETLDANLEQAQKITLRDLAFQAVIDKKLPRALDFFTKYLAKHPDDALTLTGLATVYALMGDLENGYLYAKKGYERQNSEYATLTLGYLESLRGQNDAAVIKYREALSVKPDSIPAKYNLAYVYLKMDQYEKALNIMKPLEESLADSLDKKFLRAKTLNNIGYCYWGLGDKEKALLWLSKAIEVSPEYTLAKKNFSQLQAGKTTALQAAKPTD